MTHRSLASRLNMSGSVTLVSGAAGFIGREICYSLAELGSDLILLDVNLSSLDQLRDDILQSYDVDVEIFQCDLADQASYTHISSFIEERFGRLDVLVNNAALGGTSELVGWLTDFASQSVDTWREAFEVNLTAPFLLSQRCYQLLLNSNSASIINIGSIYGSLGPDLSLYENTKMNNPAAYGASKGGLLQLTRWMATVLAPKIRVNAISPGGILRGQPQSFVERYIARTPLKRMGREEDLQGAIVYLATDMSKWVTGQNLVVDGGWSAW